MNSRENSSSFSAPDSAIDFIPGEPSILGMRFLIVLLSRMGLVQNVTDQIIQFASAEPMPVVNRHRILSVPLHRDQAGPHEQIKPAVSILQLHRRVVLIPNHAGEPASILSNHGRGLLLFSARPKNRVANLILRMISCKPCQVPSDELTSFSDLVTG